MRSDGRVDSKLYATTGGTSYGCDFPDLKLSEACYCKGELICAHRATLKFDPLILVVDVKDGDALLIWMPRPLGYWRPKYYNFSNKEVAFGGVYVRPEYVGGTPDVVCFGSIVPNTAFKIRAYVDKSALAVGRPISEASGVFVDVTPRRLGK